MLNIFPREIAFKNCIAIDLCQWLNKISWEATTDKTSGNEDEEFLHFIKIYW